MVKQIISSSNFLFFSLALLIITPSPIQNFGSATLEEANGILKWKASLEIQNNSFLSSWISLPLNSSALVPCTSWSGVVCNADGSIHRLNISSFGLKGTLHQFPFYLLHNLTHFDLYDNNFSGPIPSEIRLLSKLVYLDFSVNRFSGVIPPEIGMLASLEYLEMSLNNLTGSIPQEIDRLTCLYELGLANNLLQGEVPLTLGNLTNLAYLYLHNNSLCGPIPPNLGNLKSLTYLVMINNHFSGSIPSSLANLSNL
ncbi:probable leucine-rich repeat receptor-like protein kinase At1g35710 [Lactuca sativa]|uniref:probable leucine-rich repeat receptor-like protein kinase At1g35710 n=1 Tax=Lactuca sativa TaxID=4236 RepID=UPI000CD9D303|nr:probable leucine-rich repeat receptor-like protein kinase At1g35710 [Lactuca sativa]